MSVAREAFEHELAGFEERVRQARKWAQHTAAFDADETAERERRAAARG